MSLGILLFHACWNKAISMVFKINPILIFFLSSILVVSAVIDLKTQKIPNLITFPAMIVGIIYHCVISKWAGLLFSLEGLALGIALFIIPYLMGGMGAGDAKLVGAVGAIIGPKGVLLASLFTAIAGGVYALLIFLFNIQYFKDFIERNVLTLKVFAFTKHFIPIPADESIEKPKLCYGLAIAIGTIFYILLDILGRCPRM